MTINGLELWRLVSSLRNGLIMRQRPNLFYQPKKIAIGEGPHPPLPFLYVSQCNIISELFVYNYRPPLPSTHCLPNAFKIYHCYKAAAEIYLLPKSTSQAYLLLTLQFGLHKVKFKINHKYRN